MNKTASPHKNVIAETVSWALWEHDLKIVRKTGQNLNRKERAEKVIARLRAVIKERTTELNHVNPYELLVATVLSAQCTDERVNKVSPDLFEAFPTVKDMSSATVDDIFPFIRSISYPNNKSRHLAAMSRQIVDNYGGAVPETVAGLESLTGVGHKTAQVVAGVAFGVPTLAVDTHVFRVAHRIGLARDAKTPDRVEKQLKRLVPERDWSDLHHVLILHGRYRCKARKPECDGCAIVQMCEYNSLLQKLPPPRAGLSPKKGRYYCATRSHYFEKSDSVTDRSGTEQLSCPRCGSMNVFDARSGVTTKKVKDYRI